jgi:hypothetical protein
VDAGFPKRSCSAKNLERDIDQPKALALQGIAMNAGAQCAGAFADRRHALCSTAVPEVAPNRKD